MYFKDELEKMRNNFKLNRPKKLKLHRPWWMFVDEELSKLYTEKAVLLEQGEVYYSCLLQANVKLFEKNPPFNYPAQIVYSTLPEAQENPLFLKDTVEEIYSYKYSDKEPPKEWKELVENIRNEKDRTAYYFDCYSDNVKLTAKMQTIMVYRKHLPNRFLQENVLPIIACENICDSVIVLPSEFWSDEFKTWWINQN